jgi:hypothetical protein
MAKRILVGHRGIDKREQQKSVYNSYEAGPAGRADGVIVSSRKTHMGV